MEISRKSSGNNRTHKGNVGKPWQTAGTLRKTKTNQRKNIINHKKTKGTKGKQQEPITGKL